jgi:cell wall-associated NlpC family hydrolase
MRPLLTVLLIALVPKVVSASPDPEALDHPKFYALIALGAQYRYGGHLPETGFDCSGLVAHVFQRAWGLLLPRGADQQAKLGKPVRRQDLEPGDLVFYNTRNRAYSHVGIYVGDGRFIHAPRRGKRVRAESVDSPYWKARFNGARRLAQPV